MDNALSLIAESASLLRRVVDAASALELPGIFYSLFIPVAVFVILQALAGVIGYHAKRAWVRVFKDREKELLAANELLRLEMSHVMTVNSMLVSENARMRQENERVLKRALRAELRLTEQDSDPVAVGDWTPII